MSFNSQNISYLLLNYLFIKYQNFICASPREKADELELEFKLKNYNLIHFIGKMTSFRESLTFSKFVTFQSQK